MTTPACPSYAGYRFSAEIISHAVWLYFRFPLSLRMAQELFGRARHYRRLIGRTAHSTRLIPPSSLRVVSRIVTSFVPRLRQDGQ